MWSVYVQASRRTDPSSRESYQSARYTILKTTSKEPCKQAATVALRNVTGFWPDCETGQYYKPSAKKIFISFKLWTKTNCDNYRMTILWKSSFLTNSLIDWLNWFHGAESFFRSCKFLSYSINSSHFMETECSLPCSQKSATCSILREVNPVHAAPHRFLKDPF